MYITSTYYVAPAENTNSSSKDFWKNPKNFFSYETVNITRHLNNTDLSRANLILDVKNEEVVKCRRYFMNGEFVENPDFNALMGYFRQHYPTKLDAAIEALV